MVPTKSVLAMASLGFILLASTAMAQPAPGDVYREYTWHPNSGTGPSSTSKWERVTGPNATEAGAQAFLPNSVNHLQIDDLQHAIRAELSLEVLNVHPGTVGHKVRMNGNAWLPIPFSPLVPGTSGSGLPALEYHTMQYPVVPVSLSSIVNGNNSFEFTASNGTSFASRWPQWISYGVSLRVYYDESAKNHPTGQISSHSNGSKVGDNEVFRATTTSSTPIKQVDFVGKYSDFNWKGDGKDRQWQDQTLYSNVRNHIGSDTNAPYGVAWQNNWIPDQNQPMEVSARIVDNTGLTYITPAVTGLDLDRTFSVEMIKPYDVPRKWGTRAGNTDTAKLDVNSNLADVTEAQITLATWNGHGADVIALNGHTVANSIGKNHDLSYDSINIPVNQIQQGTNVFSTFSDTVHHGIDVQWPGPVLMLRRNNAPPVTGTHINTGLIAAYDFREGSGNTVHDVSGFGSPLDLTIQDPGKVSWSSSFLTVDTSTVIASSGAATKIINEVVAANELTVEAWIKPKDASLSGAARIVNIGTTVTSEAPLNRNFFIGQDNANIDARLRTTGGLTGNPPVSHPNLNGDRPQQQTDGTGAVVNNSTELIHVMYTRDTDGNSFIYVDGVLRSDASVTQPGDLSNWDPSYVLTLANELVYDSASQRDFLGEYHLVSFYNRALSATEVLQNFSAGPSLTSGLDGDFDGDGDVDGADFLAWQRGEASGGATTANLTLWESNFGTSATAAAANAVPEPASVMLLAIAGVLCFFRRQDKSIR